jgi:hypothetical protein
MSEELAWAGGFFDGEGSSYLMKHRTHDGYLTPAVEVPQSGWDGIPVVLTRFRGALGGLGNISRPHTHLWTDAPVSRWKTEARDDVQLTLHLPFIGDVKRSQAHNVLIVINSQPDLARAIRRSELRALDSVSADTTKWSARIRPFKAVARTNSIR